MAVLIVLLLTALAASPVIGGSIEARCSACRAVGFELSQRLEAEIPRNHIDMRHRLDKDGNRHGKVIEYKLSDLRVIHLLEDLCETMEGYELAEANETLPLRWATSASLGGGRFWNMGEVNQGRKVLHIYCDDLLERHEDTLSNALKAGRVSAEGASDFLCLATAKHCDTTLQSEEEKLAAVAAEWEAGQAERDRIKAEADAAAAAEAAAEAEAEAAAAGEPEADAEPAPEAEAAAAGDADGGADAQREEL